ncbi:MAG TPA: hypothetical protein VHN37_05170 [Actinomycetota bacterium]|nr:hypothetical protein [Actinomycetota bacterium]
MRRGIYCLANDRVLEFTDAFFESLRAVGSDLPLTVIPFDGRCERLRTLASGLDCTFLEEDELARFDRLGETFCPDPSCFRTFRKLAVFEGAFDEFVYFDTDVVVLVDPSELLMAFSESSADLVYTDRDPAEVYPPGWLRTSMIERYGSPCFNTGFFLSRRGVFTRADFNAIARLAPEPRSDLAYRNEQGFLNYCVDVSGIAATELSDVLPGLTRRQWAARSGIAWDGRTAVMADPSEPDAGRRFPFVHWAGFDVSPTMPRRDIFDAFRRRAREADARAGRP